MAREPRYWFRAKRYGWGWGLPVTWEGWAVLVSFTVLLVLGSVLFSPAKSPTRFALFAGATSLALLAVCYLKGEPPKWRWGGR
jgi:hypothetical protein